MRMVSLLRIFCQTAMVHCTVLHWSDIEALQRRTFHEMADIARNNLRLHVANSGCHIAKIVSEKMSRLKCKECHIHLIQRTWQSQTSICLVSWSKTAGHRCKWWRGAEKWNSYDFPGHFIGRAEKVIQSLDQKMPVGCHKCREWLSIMTIKRNILWMHFLQAPILKCYWTTYS
jgi:hypothetical protein